MRKLFLASLLGATVALGGCDALNKLLMPPTQTQPGTQTPTGAQVNDAQKAQEQLQAQLQQAAGFSSNLQQAAGFGVVLNAPTSALQQAAGLQQAAAFRTQAVNDISLLSTTERDFAGTVGAGDLVVDGTISGTATQSVAGHEVLSAFDFNLTVTTAHKIPSLQGATIQGNLALNGNVTAPGLSGTLTIASGSVSTPVDFTFAVGTSGPKWLLTSPVMIDGVEHFTHLEVDSSHNGSGWISRDKAGSSSMRVANCSSENGKWTVTLLANEAATQSIGMPWSN